jgi:NAD(P)-dependent dehydrogenase (short-subunit alcohol dehydrogenase family)
MDLGLGGRVALVTGSTQGIGRAVADLLSAEGASVVVSSRREEAVDATVAGLRSAGASVIGVVADVEDAHSADVLRDAALDAFGRIDIVVNNAGGYGRGGDRLTDFREDIWMDLYRLNVVSAVRLTTACLPSMLERRWGRIVNVASTFARDVDTRFAPYGAAKAALLHVTRNFSLAYASRGICSNAVLPGLTRTDGTLAGYEAAGRASDRTSEQIERRMIELQPIAADRTGEPYEVAAAIGFLCSEQASWVTGELLQVDGGTIRALP